MTLDTYKELLSEIEPRLDAASKALQMFVKNDIGLAERTAEYIEAKANYNKIFAEYRALNSKADNKMKRELSLERRAAKFKNI